jgi:hypothetical protein
MFRKTTLIIFALTLMVSISCSDNGTSPDANTIIGSGNLTTVERSVAAFNSITTLIPVTITIQYGTEQNLSVTVDDNVVDYIITSVENGTLVITSQSDVNLNQIHLSLDLTMTDLEDITVIGPATIAGEFTLPLDDFYLTITGAATINFSLEADQMISSLPGSFTIMLRGQVIKHIINHSGSGYLSAFDLISDTTIVNLSGAGSEEVYVNDLLDVNISGVGNVYYKGAGEIQVNITGIGNVISWNP